MALIVNLVTTRPSTLYNSVPRKTDTVQIKVAQMFEYCFPFYRQIKDQNKKVANLKHKEQVEKKKSAQMLEEARRREDNLSDSSQQLQVKQDRVSDNRPSPAWALSACLASLLSGWLIVKVLLLA